MLQVLYMIAFLVLTVLAITNLVRSLFSFGTQTQKPYTQKKYPSVTHPELLDDAGNVINEPLMVMRSLSMDEAKEKLESLYKSSPGNENLE
jgi:Protein of unknown function (DUF2973)